MQHAKTNGRAVYVVDGCRTPFLKARGRPGPFSSSDLAVQAARTLLARQSIAPTELSEVITGCVMPEEANISRIIALRLGCGKTVPAFTVQRNCASGMQALDNAFQDIIMGRSDLVLAGGTEAMSHAPLFFGRPMVEWLSRWYCARSIAARVKLLPQFRLSYLMPVMALVKGLSDPLVGLSMGQTAEELAYRFNITREEMDAFAVMSHQRAARAQSDNLFQEEITPIFDHKGNCYERDDGIRADSSVEKLATLSPFFDKKFGQVTAGNSSQVTDGAAYLLLASAQAVKQHKLPILGRIVDTEWAGVDPAVMGLGPANAIPPLLKRHALTLDNIDAWEINEAFAVQVLADLKAWECPEYCKEHLNLQEPFGTLDQSRLNVDGGAIALGHPVGASGARLVLHLLNTLKRQGSHYGVASLCIGGGQGGAMLLENVSEVSHG